MNVKSVCLTFLVLQADSTGSDLVVARLPNSKIVLWITDRFFPTDCLQIATMVDFVHLLVHIRPIVQKSIPLSDEKLAQLTTTI